MATAEGPEALARATSNVTTRARRVCPYRRRLVFGGDTDEWREIPGLVDPFYAWASVIENGRVVATDYAPDVGWLSSEDDP